MGLRNFKDMARTPAEKSEEIANMGKISVPDYPYGLCISLDETDLENLGIDADFEVGDIIHIAAFARVTSMSSRMHEEKPCCRVELQIEQMAVEDESTEEDED